MDAEINELYADSIEFSYNDFTPILTGVYISCKKGEIVGLLGRNGCGKSTLMKIIFGVLKPRTAFIRINQKKYNKGYLSKKLCYLPQHKFLPSYLTVKKVLDLLVSNREKKEILLFEDEIISTVKTQKIAELSVGEQRYLELIILLQQNADFYLLDEPFSGVAPYMKEKIQQVIKSQADKGFIISDHHYNSVLEIASKIILLQNGGCRIIHSKKELEMFYVPEGTFDEE